MKTYRMTATLVGSAYVFSNITFILGAIVMVESILGSPDYQKILFYGASGAVGTFAVQLASRHFGADVTGVCSGAKEKK